MIPYTQDVILASADQVAIDAVAAKLMGFDHCGTSSSSAGAWMGRAAATRAISRSSATWKGEGELELCRPFKKHDLRQPMQHKIYWGPLQEPVNGR